MVNDIIADMLSADGADEKAIEKFSEKMSDIAKMGEGSAESFNTVIEELTILRDTELSAAVGDECASTVKATLNQLIECIEVRGKRLSFRGYAENTEEPGDGPTEEPTDDGDGTDASTPQMPSDEESTERTFIDIIRIIFDRIADWFKKVFGKHSD